ncbi:MAG: DEAD/DEAH box helicase family protein [Candidatus Heimdallarchaeota archaeon]
MSSYKRTVKIKLLDEVNCAIIGLHPDHIEHFYNHFARKVENYFFNPKFKLGVWDGKIRYFHNTGKTYVYLLPEIVPKLKSLGYRLEVVDNRINEGVDVAHVDKDVFAHILNDDDEPFELRYYQLDSVNKLIDNGGGVVVAGTGSGKTLMNAALVDAYGKQGLKTLTIVPSQDLIKQTKADFIMWGLDTGEYSGDQKDIKHTHVVSTWQALQHNPRVITEFQAVVVDECHGLKGQVLTKLLNEYGKNIIYRFGLTGTLPKGATDAMAVRIAIGDTVYEIPAHVLIEQGYLAKLKIDIFQLEENFKEQYQDYLKQEPVKPKTYIQFKDSYFAEYTDEKRYLQSYEERLQWIADLIEVKRDLQQGNVFCLVDGINFGKKLAKRIPGAIFVHGKDKQKARKEIYDLFKNNDDLVVIASVQIASTGLNIKRIFNLMLIDLGKSFIRIIQTIGRGLRLDKDKKFVSVSDVCSDLKYGKKHVRERIRFYKDAKYPYKKTVVNYDEE